MERSAHFGELSYAASRRFGERMGIRLGPCRRDPAGDPRKRGGVSLASLYANENFPRQVVEALRRLGHDVLTSQEAGNAGRGVPDEVVLAFAVRTGRAVVTLNRRD